MKMVVVDDEEFMLDCALGIYSKFLKDDQVAAGIHHQPTLSLTDLIEMLNQKVNEALDRDNSVIILMDHELANEIKGWKVIAAFREEYPQHSGVPVFIHSSKAEEAQKAWAAAGVGNHGNIPKPLEGKYHTFLNNEEESPLVGSDLVYQRGLQQFNRIRRGLRPSVVSVRAAGMFPPPPDAKEEGDSVTSPTPSSS